jgi:hypothetical protein
MVTKAGQKIWIRCEVKPGPFPDEKLVRVQSGDNEWVGFVNVDFLKKRPNGDFFVQGKVTDGGRGDFTVVFPGHSITSSQFQGSSERVIAVGSV